MMTPIVRNNMQLFPPPRTKAKPSQEIAGRNRAKSMGIIYEQQKRHKKRVSASTSDIHKAHSSRSSSLPCEQSANVNVPNKIEQLHQTHIQAAHIRHLEGRLLQEIPEATSDAELGAHSSLSRVSTDSKLSSATAHGSIAHETIAEQCEALPVSSAPTSGVSSPVKRPKSGLSKFFRRLIARSNSSGAENSPQT